MKSFCRLPQLIGTLDGLLEVREGSFRALNNPTIRKIDIPCKRRLYKGRNRLKLSLHRILAWLYANPLTINAQQVGQTARCLFWRGQISQSNQTGFSAWLRTLLL